MNGALAGRCARGAAGAGGDLARPARPPASPSGRRTSGCVPDEPACPDAHALPGIIDALLFVGDRYEARVTLGGEHSILLLLPRAPEWREGQRVRLGFPPELVSVWPA